MILEAHGLRVELPRGWSGRIFARDDGIATLHAGSFPVSLHDGDFGEHSTALMPDGGSFFALTEYRPGGGLEPGVGLFAPNGPPRQLDPSRFSVRGLAHPRPGQLGTQHFFTAHGRPLCLYVVISGGRMGRRSQLAALDHVLGTVQIAQRT
ncbi:MAG TPA: hypothetical protein VGI87_11410 [Solirubrobacteraceae bacterium]